MPAIAADFAVWLLVDVMTSSEGVPEGYHPDRSNHARLLCFALLVIYGGSIGIRSFGLRHRITIFEIAQGVLAFALASFGAMRASHGSAAPALGVLFLLLAAACYWGALSRFAERGSHSQSSRLRDLGSRSSAGGKLPALFRKSPGAVLVPGRSRGGFRVYPHAQA